MPTVAIWLNGPDDESARSILNPVSFVLLSVQPRSIRLEEMAVAFRLPGGDGIRSAVVVVVGTKEVLVVVGSTEVVEVAGTVVVVLLVVTKTVVVVEATVVVVKGVTSHTSPMPSPSPSRWSLMHNPLDEQPITQSASLVQLMPGLSEVAEQVPRFGPLGLLGQLS